MRADIAPGGTFPDYELPDHTKAPRRLSELQGGDQIILTLACGHYCPKEHQQHRELVELYPNAAVAYTQIATISTDVTREIRPDWDLAAPGLRAAWVAGDHTSFHPYDHSPGGADA